MCLHGVICVHLMLVVHILPYACACVVVYICGYVGTCARVYFFIKVYLDVVWGGMYMCGILGEHFEKSLEERLVGKDHKPPENRIRLIHPFQLDGRRWNSHSDFGCLKRVPERQRSTP